MEITKTRLGTKKSQYKLIKSILMQVLEAAKQAICPRKLCMGAGLLSPSQVPTTESKIGLLSRSLH